MPCKSLYDFTAGAPKRRPEALPPKEFTVGSLHPSMYWTSTCW